MADGPRADDHGHALATAAQRHATGDSAGALELLPELVAARPHDLQVRLLLARCLATAGAPSVALAAADAAVECDPTSWAAHTLVAQAAVGIDPDRAEAAAARAVELAPGEPEAHRVQAEVQAVRAQRATAAEAVPTGAAARLGAALGGGRKATTAVPAAPEPPAPLEPRLPAALAGPNAPAPEALPPAPPPRTGDEIGRVPAGSDRPLAGRPPEPALANVQPEPALALEKEPAKPELAEPERAEPEPPLPRALGGEGLGGSDQATAKDGEIGTGRLVIRVVGLLFWLALAFRILVQVVGGPIGIVLFLAALVGLGYVASRIKEL